MYPSILFTFLALLAAVDAQWKRANVTSLDDKPVEKIEELQCNFSSPCAWRSSNTTDVKWHGVNGYTDLVWWIQQTPIIRTPDKEFLRLLPQSKVSDRLESSEIACQNGEGILTFDYYVQHNTAVRACVLEAENRQVIQCSGFYPKAPPTTGARFTVPGRNQSFRLAIIANKGRGFAVIDNVRYSANLCNSENETSSEIGTTSISDAEKITDRRQGQYINNTDDLVCDFSGEWGCRWGPVGGEWTLLDYVPNMDILGTDDEPFLPAALLRKNESRFVSDPIGCQKRDSQLIIKWWTPPDVQIKVCAIATRGGEELVCSEILDQKHEGYPGPIVLEFSKPIDQPFEWHIIPTWGEADDEYLILDELAYFGQICVDDIPEPPIAVATPWPRLVIKEEKFASISDDLVCDFAEQFPCNWHSTGEPWQLVNDTVDADLIGTRIQPVSPAAKISYKQGPVISDPVMCQKGKGQFIFKGWMSEKVALRVCASDLSSNVLLFCSPSYDRTHTEYPGPVVVEFKEPIHKPFKWHIIPDWNRAGEGDFLIVDELAYFADICAPGEQSTEDGGKKSRGEFESRIASFASSTRRPITLPPTTQSTTTAPLPDSNDVCALLPCDFSENACYYRQTERPGMSTFERRDTAFGHPLSRINDIRTDETEGHFMAALLQQRRSALAMLESPTLNVTRALDYLTLRVFRPSAGVTLRVCFQTNDDQWDSDNFAQCRVIIPELTAKTARHWMNVRVIMRKSVTKFYLVAHHQGQVSNGFAALAIDDIQLASCLRFRKLSQ